MIKEPLEYRLVNKTQLQEQYPEWTDKAMSEYCDLHGVNAFPNTVALRVIDGEWAEFDRESLHFDFSGEGEYAVRFMVWEYNGMIEAAERLMPLIGLEDYYIQLVP
jgi:hypothetical protein